MYKLDTAAGLKIFTLGLFAAGSASAHGPGVSVTEHFSTLTTDTAETLLKYPAWSRTGTSELVVSREFITPRTDNRLNMSPTGDGETVFDVAGVPGDLFITGEIGTNVVSPGGWNAGLSIGDNRIVFHPGLAGGQLRVEGPGGFGNQDMGFTPAFNTMHIFKVSITAASKVVKIEVLDARRPIPNKYTASFIATSYDPGVIRIGFRVEGPSIAGAVASFDRFTIRPHTTMVLDATDSHGDCAEVGTWDVNNLTCTLTQDVSNAFVIEDDGITLDGAGHTTTGGRLPDGAFYGVYVSYNDDITIKNLDITGVNYGIVTRYSDDIKILNNTIKARNLGISSTGHPSCHYGVNELNLNSCSNRHVIKDNLVGLPMSPGGNALLTQYTRGYLLDGNTFYGGIQQEIFETDGATITNNTFSAFYYIFGVNYSNDNTFSGNTFTKGNYSGVTISNPNASPYTLEYNIARAHPDDLVTGHKNGSHNTFTGNTFSHTGGALNVVTGMNDMVVTGNNFKNLFSSNPISNGSNTGNTFDGNWFDTFDEPAEGCDDDGNGVCVQDFIINSLTVDANPLTAEIGGVQVPANALSSCSAILEADGSTPDGMYWIDPSQSGDLVNVYCDMTTDGGGWTLAGYGEEANLNTHTFDYGRLGVKDLTKATAGYNPLERWGRARINAVDLAQGSTEVALSWSEHGLPAGNITSYGDAVRFPIPDPANVTLAPTALFRSNCGDGNWTLVDVTRLVLSGDPDDELRDLPEKMYTRTDSLTAGTGHNHAPHMAYGLVSPPAPLPTLTSSFATGLSALLIN